MQNHLTLKSCLTALGLALAVQPNVQAQTFIPIPLTPSSFTASMVIPSNWPYHLNSQAVTVILDSAGANIETVSEGSPAISYYSVSVGACFNEIGLWRSSSLSNTYGLPHGGTLLTNATLNTAANMHVYQLPYWTNYNSNCLYIGNFNETTLGPYIGKNYTSGSLTLNTGTSNYTALSFLVTAGNGPVTNKLVISYADGTTQTINPFGFPDWFATANSTTTTAQAGGGPAATFAYTADGRFEPAVQTNVFENTGTTSGSRLWSVDIGLTDTTSAPTNVMFTWTGGGRGPVFAVSGGVNTNDKPGNTGALIGPFSPISVSGFNAGCVVAAPPSWGTNGLYPLTATMDNGTNLLAGGNTFFEKGYDLVCTSNGFPVHGATLTSVANPARTYQMPASYFTNMCILVDTNHQLANITPITPVAYTAISLLTAGASIGAANTMTNYIILQHLDGVNESNVFFGYDWFNNTIPYAYSCNERVTTENSTSDAGFQLGSGLNSGDPRLFESEFGTVDGSPITNIQVGYRQSGATTWTTYVIAVSGTTNFVPVVAGTNTLVQNVYAGQTAKFTANVSLGTLPNYFWYITDGATFTNLLMNGATGTGSIISGANTSTLSIANVSAADTGNDTYSYMCLFTNSAPSSGWSAPAPLTLLISTATNIVQPGDSISDFFGGSLYAGSAYNSSGSTTGEGYPSPTGLTVNYAIDGTDQQYLNYGSSGSDTSFQGPIGIIVQPSTGGTVVSALRFIVPINAAVCDPADFALDGSPDGVNWTNIVLDQALNLNNLRNLSQIAPVNVTNQILQEVDFTNTTNYNYYRVAFANTKGGSAYNSLQIGEIQFLGTVSPVPPGILVQPFPQVQSLLAGGSVTWTTVGNGPGPITYQWYQIVNGVISQIMGATNSSLVLSNVTTAMSGNLYYCLVTNPYGTTSSQFVKLIVLTKTLSQYASAVLADNPIAFLRLDEGTNNPPTSDNDGVVASDIIGGHDGVYSNTVLQANPPGSYSTNDPSELPAEFGTIIDPDITADPRPSGIVPQDNYVGGISGINFGSPTNTTTNFSVEAWVYLNADTNGGAGVIAQGPGGGEQFAVDMGGTANAFRFYFRDAGTNSLVVSPNVAPSNNVWYHLVGVMSEVQDVVTATYTNYAANESLYLNGVLVATNQTLFSNAPGLFVTSAAITIGARQSGSTTNFNYQLNGAMANVAIYNYALSGAQVSNHYNATAQSPGILVQPSPLVQNMQLGATGPIWSVVTTGAQPITYQWYQVTTNGGTLSTNLVPNATNAAFVLSNASLSSAGAYYCSVTSPYGSTNTIFVTANVIAPTSEYVSTVLADAPIAFFRLDEGPDNGLGNDGVIACDSFGGHDGVYSNTMLQAQGYSLNDPDDYAAEFGLYVDQTLATPAVADNYVGGINGLNFFSPSNTDISMSVETWVNLHGNVASAGVVSKGYGNGGEEFALDTDGTGDDFRFYFRDAGGASHTVSPNVAPVDGAWYHVVGVLYESNNVAYEYLYTNGVLGATTVTTFANPPGLLSNDVAPVTIGARQSATGTNFNLQLNGVEANVALYNYALSAAQVQNHYLASGVAPTFTVVPTNVTVLLGQSAPAVFYSSAFGTSNSASPMVYQWSYNGQNLTNGPSPTGTGAIISGATTPTLSISGFTINDNGDYFTVTVTNNYGSINASAQLTVAAGAPVLEIDVQTPISVLAGTPVSISATFSGSLPFTYQWTYNGMALANGARISGAISNVLTISPTLSADAGTYQLNVSNIYGNAQSGLAVLTVLPSLTFDGFGSGWSFNKSVPGGYSGGYVASNVLETTDGSLDEAVSSFYGSPLYIGAFEATFTYTDVNGRGYENDADGSCFVLQNSTSGAAALGADGGDLGYTGITPSVALEFNLYQGLGVFFGADGAIVTTPVDDTLPLDIATGDPINVTLTYIGGTASILLQDPVSGYSFSTTTNVNLPGVLGTNMAFVGFTGGDGGVGSVQQISNFEYIPLPDLLAQAAGSHIVLSWPTGTGGYQLESNTNLASANWVNVTNAVVVTNNQNQVTVPISAGSEFYRLQLQ